MRKWHRWISLFSFFFMFFIALTGLLLQLDLYISGHAPPGSPPGSDTPPLIEGYEGLHGILQDIHAGYVFGTAGRILSILLACGLLVLSVTGIVMYVRMYKMRKKGNRHGWLWK